jgi:hypothetical protein
VGEKKQDVRMENKPTSIVYFVGVGFWLIDDLHRVSSLVLSRDCPDCCLDMLYHPRSFRYPPMVVYNY